jgi:peptide/nickel transport system substrate-binding protein
MFVKLNTEKPPFKDNPKLWMALNLAVDRQAIVDSLWGGLGTLEACQVLSPAYFGYNPKLKPIPFDPVRAKALLTEAGFPNGLAFDLDVPTGRYLQASDIAQIIAAQLGDIGVQVKLREIEFGSWMNNLMVTHTLSNAAYFGLAWPTLDAGGLLAFWESSNPEAYYSNKDFDRVALAAHSTNDGAKRTQLYAELTEDFCAAPPAILMFFQPLTYGERKSIAWQPRGDDWVRAMDVSPR